MEGCELAGATLTGARIDSLAGARLCGARLDKALCPGAGVEAVARKPLRSRTKA